MKITAEQVYKEYLRGKSFFEKHGYYTRCDDSYTFYNGDQWRGLKTSGEKPPVLNVLAPIVDHKVATVSQDGITLNYSSMNYGKMRDFTSGLCEMLSQNAQRLWEKLKMDREIWNLATESAICGDAFAYFFMNGDEVEYSSVDTTNVHFADETESDVQKQKYIIVVQRLFVEDVKKAAEINGVKKEERELILPDSETGKLLGDKAKRAADDETGDGKCLCFLRMWKEGGEVHFLRSTKDVIYQPDTAVRNMKLYPLAHMVWKQEKGFSRGRGEVYGLIPNQVEINKALARYLAVIKHCAYPHIVYNRDVVDSEEEIMRLLNTVGSVIGLDSPRMQRVEDVIGYLQPAQINPAAMEIIDDLQKRTRDLAGASEIATGDINPEQASGAAIIAVKDAAALPLNNQEAHLKQFSEDIARIWFDMWCAYSPEGVQAEVLNSAGQPVPMMIPAEVLGAMKLEVRVDVSPRNPYSKYAQEQALQNLLSAGYITFEEYVDSLDDDAAAPKGKLSDILAKRTAAMQQAAAEAAALSDENAPSDGGGLESKNTYEEEN